MDKNGRLLKKYQKLNTAEQDVLLVLAILFTPLGQTKFSDFFRTLKHVDAAGAKKIGKKLREQLERDKLITVSYDGWRCAEEIRDVLMKLAEQERPELLQEINVYFLNERSYVSQHLGLVYLLKKLRMAVYLNDIEEVVNNICQIYEQYESQVTDALDVLIFDVFDIEWFETRDIKIRCIILQTYFAGSYLNLIPIPFILDLAKPYVVKKGEHFQGLLELYIQNQLLWGQLEDVMEVLNNVSTLAVETQAMNYFLTNNNSGALKSYQRGLAESKRSTKKRNVCLMGLSAFFFHLSLIKSGTPEDIALLKSQIAIVIKNDADYFTCLNRHFLEFLAVYQGTQQTLQSLNCSEYLQDEYLLLFAILMKYWLDDTESIESDTWAVLHSYVEKSIKVDNHLYAALGSTLMHRIFPNKAKLEQRAAKYTESPFLFLMDYFPRVEKWEKALKALTHLNAVEEISQTHNSSRMVWLLSLTMEGDGILEPREQKLGKTGKWSKGRAVALKRLYHDASEIDFLTAQDRRICQQIQSLQDYNYGYYNESYELSSVALSEAIGHPHIYWATANQYITPIGVKKAEPQLLVTKKGDNLHLILYPSINEFSSIVIERTADNELLIYSITEQHLQVAEILGSEGLIVPKAAKQQVIDSISSIASTLDVQSELGGLASNIETVESDSRLHLHLLPAGEGLEIDAFVQPFSDAGPIYKPAMGGLTVLAEVDEKQLQTERDFSLEQQYLQQVHEQCPELYATNDCKWLLDDPEMALNALMQLQDLGDFATLEWPKGQRIKVTRELNLTDAHFSVRKEKDWFSIDGELKINDTEVYDMQRLINLLNATKGRFLKLEDGQFVALTKELRQRLDDITGLGEQKGNKLLLHNLAAPALNEALEGMDIQASKQWQTQLKKLETMADLEPVLPSTLQGELRDYQLEGFQWMMRLAHWGAGACLADDMGLGKTIQSIALLLHRAPEGPALILAPTSVCMNWLDEIQRFAPTLNVLHFATAGDREKIINDAAAFDVLVCSYGLLQTESERLTNKQWHTAIADEAQALKNGATKRSKAAMALQADFKMVTTGTPIENHLGELWNLFHFINPGLLGSLQKFNERYAQAIENDKDHDVQQRLKKLLRPFILRRLKTDVLKELPSRTEITLHVELSPEERTFYEALRRNAMQTMAASQEQGGQAGAQHLQVLAEIMKLRRACCHPQLVIADSLISSAKLQAFEELVEELIEGRHKALVFSQFVGHLHLLRDLLDKKGISYQYLDGSTSVAKRKKGVNAFQAGEGDIFLISLKAGGSGLNLTAADYVIHMDPWWNPAVEDQASDRAHRMGQKRPVTIYRLVAKDTIEDKIVDLHAHKRDLANSLLEGGEVSGKMSVSDMMALIREVEN